MEKKDEEEGKEEKKNARKKLKLVEKYVISMGLSCLQMEMDLGNILGKWSVCLKFSLR